jgi:hypothetical protein
MEQKNFVPSITASGSSARIAQSLAGGAAFIPSLVSPARIAVSAGAPRGGRLLEELGVTVT